jgi:acetyl-CoA C-acetyltransferase
MKAVMLATQAIRAGDAQALVAGGMESMSNAPYLLRKARTGYRMGNGELIDAVINDGLWCAFEHIHMGSETEMVVKERNITREEQDRLALESHQKAAAATTAGRFKEEIVAIEVAQKKGTLVVDSDETIRPDTNLEALARLKPAFEADGTITAGNAPGLSDGASATIVVDSAFAQANGLTPLARIVAYAAAGIEPRYFSLAPTRAVRRVMEISGLKINDFNLIEVNEAFAAQTLADGKELDWDWSRVNVNGGAIALGHPIGSSGSRILITLIHELRRRGGGRGLATLCLGGGGAVAMAIEV